MTKREYVPFSEVRKNKTIIVDSVHPEGLVLGHWRGARTPDRVRHDTSAGCVLNALELIPDQLDIPFVSANHFDVDGFVGVWSLLNPELAIEHKAILHQMAIIGDFRELDLNLPGAEVALKLVCWINYLEKELFYPPFGAEELPETEQILCTQKFEYFNEHFTYQLQHPDNQPTFWQEEYNRVMEDYGQVNSNQCTVKKYPEIGLVIIDLPRPVHYYALFGPTRGYDIVLTCYKEQRYELEYKYTTWVDIVSRPTLPRINLKTLIQDLNLLESTTCQWSAENITDTGPIMRLNAEKLSKVQRYGHPFERPIYSSSIPPEEVKELVIDFFSKAYQNIKPKRFWTWAEIKNAANQE